MEFNENDYLINLDKLKATFFEELTEVYGDGNGTNCPMETRLRVMREIVLTIESQGQKMGD